MDKKSSFFKFSLSSSQELKSVVAEIEKVVQKHIYVNVFAYMHNTVLMHNLTKELERLDENVKISLLPAEKGSDILIHLYTFDDASYRYIESNGVSIQALLLAEYQEKTENLELSLKQSNQDQLQHYFHDTLTGLANLYQLRDDLLENDNSTLIMVQIDNFNIINDYYGFVAGDFLLEAFAKTLKEKSFGDALYRTSGAHFAIRLDERLDFYSLKDLLEEISRALKHLSYNYYDTVMYVDVTLGSVISNTHSNIFSKVGMALQYAKENHLPFWIYEQRMHFEDIYETNLKASLSIRKAVLNSRIIPYFQPIISNKTGEIVQYESLSRLQDENGIILVPSQFLEIAKKIKIYNEITKTMIQKTLEIMKEGSFKVTINLSFDDIMSSEINSFILEKLEEGTLGDRIVFELLATEPVYNLEKVQKFIREIKRHGAEISIDDFGCGFSNFSYLTTLDVDYVKIDGTLIKDIDTNGNNAIAVEAIVGLAKRLNIKSIAEFVHSSSTLAKVKSLGIDYSQGYYIDEPTPMKIGDLSEKKF